MKSRVYSAGHGRVPGGPFVGCQRARERLGQWARTAAGFFVLPLGGRRAHAAAQRPTGQVWPERAAGGESGDLGDAGRSAEPGRLDEQECEGQCGWHEALRRLATAEGWPILRIHPQRHHRRIVERLGAAAEGADGLFHVLEHRVHTLVMFGADRLQAIYRRRTSPGCGHGARLAEEFVRAPSAAAPSRSTRRLR